ncbi:putative arylsulfatase [Talaromyces proteolyticus]|uniref:Arylsulfatase n=1 Tax=Talaromyces proteolyticus TaxID=1131652 RepID=A0AAD4KLL6_9EURO|nr:putative arylsulfatase [Talaromyces proteolyticus]KAH8690901.1 putative arylsulfatase [Talaromyces proteolyticus]
MSRKNILLLIADDLGKQLSCYGATTIQTPSIDQLASQGTLFDYAFASTASCSGSRSVLYTGLHTHQNGQYGLASHRHHFVTFDHVDSAPRLLNQAGYRTGIIGKIHVGPDPVYPWEVRRESDTRDVAVVADQAREFFLQSQETDAQRPFFLTIGFIDPHRDRTRAGFGNDASNSYDERITPGKYTAENVEIPSFINDTPGTRHEFAEYYNSIHRLDQGVGLVLAALEDTGLADSTLVIFVSDNGPPFLNSKTTLYDAGVRLPLLIRQPSPNTTTTHAVRSPNMVSYVDILPTILDYAGAPLADATQKRIGRSLLPLLGTSTVLSGWNQAFGSHTFHEVTNYWPTRFIRTRRWKYHRNLAWRLDFPFAADLYGSLSWEDIRNSSSTSSGEEIKIGGRKLKDYFFRPAEELYDLENDPDEIHNLVNDSEYVEVLGQLRTKLDTWQRRTEDPWLYKDGVSVWFVRYHLPAGLKLPDRQDFDAERPGNRGPAIQNDLTWGAEVSVEELYE